MGKYLLFYPLAVLPCGVGLLLAYWFPHAWIRLTCSPASLLSATFVLVKVGERGGREVGKGVREIEEVAKGERERR